VEAGLVREVHGKGNPSGSMPIERHHHFVCERCGRVEDIRWFDFPCLVERSQLGSRVVRDYAMILRGTSGSCSSRIHRIQQRRDIVGKVARQVVEQAGVNADVLLNKLLRAAGAEFTTFYYYTILRVNAIGFDG